METSFTSMEPNTTARATMLWSQYDDGLQVLPIASPGIERVPLEHSHTEQLPQFAPGLEELELAYAEIATAPEKQAVVQSAQRDKTVTAAPRPRAKILIWAGLLFLAVVIIIVAVVATLETRGPRSMLDSNEEASTATTSGPTLTSSGHPSTTSSGSAARDADTWRSTSGAYNGTGLTAVTPDYQPSPCQVMTLLPVLHRRDQDFAAAF